MAQVTVSINGRDYVIACEDGQESRLRDLAGSVNRRVEEVAAAVGQAGEARLLVMSSLMLADELAETYRQLDELREKPAAQDARARAEQEDELADTLENMAQRIETIADRIGAG